MSRNIRALSRRAGLKENLFTGTQTAAGPSGSPSQEALSAQGRRWLSGEANALGVASFYNFLQAENQGKTRWVCKGTACLLNGSSTAAASISGNHGTSLCVGYCYQGGGLLEVDGQGDLQTRGLKDGRFDATAMPVYSLSGTPILTSAVGDTEALYSLSVDDDDTQQQLQRSGLRGRGGAGFPFASKLAACAAEQVAEKYIVCNADEGDPGAFSDRYLLEQQAHKVLAGMFHAGRACGATTGVLYIRREYPEAIASIIRAIDEFEQLPTNLRAGFVFHIVIGAGSYVCGEETALLNSIEGLRPEVRTRPPYPARYGLWGQPTVVSNVETFANIPWILAHGGAAFAAIGHGKSTGTKLLSLDAAFRKPGLYEVDLGTGLRRVIEQAGGFCHPVKAIQLGGPLGCIIPTSQLGKLQLDFETMQQAGFALGHAGMVSIPADYPMRNFLQHLFEYMAHESCGKCSPCRLGTAKGASLLRDAGAGKAIDTRLFSELLETLELGSLCALGGGLPLPVRNALTWFSDELQEYFNHGMPR